MIIPKKEIKIWPNSKPWVNKDIRELLKRKQHAFKTGDLVEKRRIQKELSQHNETIKTITGFGKQNNPVVPPGGISTFLSDLNQFYARFDNNDFTDVNYDLRETLKNYITDDEKIVVDIAAVERSLKGLKTNKSAGPDRIGGKVLKSCFKELSPVLRDLLGMFTIS